MLLKKDDVTTISLAVFLLITMKLKKNPVCNDDGKIIENIARGTRIYVIISTMITSWAELYVRVTLRNACKIKKEC